MLRITWPAVLPTWIASLRTGLGLGFMFVVAAELMGASEGLGYLLLDGQQMGRADSILVAMIMFALLGQGVRRRAGRAHPAAAALAGHGAVAAMTTLAIDGLGKTYADGTEALRDMHMMARSGEIVAILGGSGCGKTTLLRLIAGLDQPSAGVIAIDGQPISGTHPAISAVFQEPRLLPWLTVGRNIAFGGRRIAKPERQRRVADLLERIGLAGYGVRWPKDLSGGQQQRVAIARALIGHPGDSAAGRAVLRTGRLHPGQPARAAAGICGRNCGRPSWSSRMTWTRRCSWPTASW